MLRLAQPLNWKRREMNWPSNWPASMSAQAPCRTHNLKKRRKAEVADDLTPKQSLAVSALICHSTVKAAATSIGVTDRTLRTWMQSPAFRQALREAQREALDSTMRVL